MISITGLFSAGFSVMTLTSTKTYFLNNRFVSGYKLMKYRGSSGDN
ncbi:hypothetical protein F0Z19_0502 [Vibrio cyclitrophicus]|nr:hypothetical protein F0Z19_0502 [Vibrio cyclitrophicus]